MAFQFVRANSQNISSPDNSVLDLSGEITIHAIVKQSNTSATEQRGLVSKYVGTGNQRSYQLQINQNKIFGVISADGIYPPSGGDLIGASNVGTNSCAVCIVFKPSTSFECFFNGVSDGKETANVPNAIYNSTSDLRIGSLETGVNGFNGDISEVAIYNVALTDAEVISLANGFKPTRVRPQNLRFYLPLIRNLQDIRNALTLTNNNSSTPANYHPRVY